VKRGYLLSAAIPMAVVPPRFCVLLYAIFSFCSVCSVGGVVMEEFHAVSQASLKEGWNKKEFSEFSEFLLR
jgi:hypothetical protein